MQPEKKRPSLLGKRIKTDGNDIQESERLQRKRLEKEKKKIA